MNKPLTKAELAELKAAGIEYPWSARDMLRLVREIRFLDAVINHVVRDDHPPDLIAYYRQNVCSNGTCPRCVSGQHCHEIHTKMANCRENTKGQNDGQR